MDNYTDLTPEELAELEQAQRILGNIQADLSNALNNRKLFAMSTMSKGDFLQNLLAAVGEVENLLKAFLKDPNT
jgi:hypothetical protein